MSYNPKIGIIIGYEKSNPNFCETLSSCTNQDYNNKEIIVVNGPNDLGVKTIDGNILSGIAELWNNVDFFDIVRGYHICYKNKLSEYVKSMQKLSKFVGTVYSDNRIEFKNFYLDVHHSQENKNFDTFLIAKEYIDELHGNEKDLFIESLKNSVSIHVPKILTKCTIT